VTKPPAAKLRPSAKKGAARATRPMVALAAASPLALAMYADPHRPIEKSRGRRETGEGTWIEIVDYIDPVTGQILWSIEYSGSDDSALPSSATYLEGNGRPYRHVEFGHDGSGRLIRVTERDKDGNLQRVTTYTYYQDGSCTVTVTDYTTSPATVTVYK
jgi:hypothetical protein